MTKLLVDAVLDPDDLNGLMSMLDSHAGALEAIWSRAGLLGGPIQEAQVALEEASRKIFCLRGCVEQHIKDARIVAL